MIRNERGLAMGYVLITMVVSSLLIYTMSMRTNEIGLQKSNIQRLTDVAMFMRGLSNMLDYSVGCSNALGYGYHTATSANFANDFNPDLGNPQNPNVVIRVPGGNNNILYRAWAGDPLVTPPPPEALASPKLLIRSIALQKNIPPGALATAADLATFPRVAIQDATLTPGPAVPPPAVPCVDFPCVEVRAVSAQLVMTLENFKGEGTFFNRTITRAIDLILYVERPYNTTQAWKVVTCTPNKGMVTLPGWLNSTDYTEQGAVVGGQACAQQSYAVGVRTASVQGAAGPYVSLRCAQMKR